MKFLLVPANGVQLTKRHSKMKTRNFVYCEPGVEEKLSKTQLIVNNSEVVASCVNRKLLKRLSLLTTAKVLQPNTLLSYDGDG